MNDSSASGFIQTGFEGISSNFTEVEILQTTDINILARAKRYGKWWLLKGINPAAAESMVHIQMLRKEFETLMLLSNSAVVQAVALEQVDDIGVCIVMEYVEGVTLDERLKANPSKSERLRIANQLLDAVEYIHSHEIAHRDLKPSNIMISNNGGSLKIIDFGLADSDRNAILKQPGGTRRYMSPEQEVHSEADVRNDIYSVGIILQDLNLGWKYNHITKRCLKPIEQRYQSIGDLKTAFRRASRIVNDAAKVAYAVLLVVAVAMIFIGRGAGTGEANRETIDSLQNLLNTTQNRVHEMEQADSIANAETEAFNRIIKEGYDEMEKSWQRDLAGLEKVKGRDNKVDYIISMLTHIRETYEQFVKNRKDSQTEEQQYALLKTFAERQVFVYNYKFKDLAEKIQNEEQ